VQKGRRAAVVALAALCACSSSSSTAETGSSSATPEAAELTVFAASSLTAAFTQIGSDFEAANPGTTVTFNFGPSDGLAGQIESEGAADVFASASAMWMDDVQQKVGVTDRADFAKNRLVAITPADNPANIRSLADLGRPGVQLVLAAEGVPVGDYARQTLVAAGFERQAGPNIVSNEQDDASVVAKIIAGEADAAIVYSSDVTDEVAPDVSAIEIPDEVNVIATYPIAVVEGAAEPELGALFVEYVTGTDAQATLARFGFLPPA
jgi:molybdate transport system substrate-binding protein